jgi:plastocyanin
MKPVLLIALVVLVAVVSGCSEDYARQANIYNSKLADANNVPSSDNKNMEYIEIRDAEFIPESVVISKGSTVVWTNMDSGEKYTVDSDVGNVDSDEISAGDSYAVTFNATGTYRYHSNSHSSMEGKIIVKDD